MDFFIPITFAMLFAVTTKSYAALTYRYTDKICAEIRVNDKTVHNCEGHASFKKGPSGKYMMEVAFKTNEFVGADSASKKTLENDVKGTSNELVLVTPEFTEQEWGTNLKSKFALVDTHMIVGDKKVKLSDTMILKKQNGKDQAYQIDAIVPSEQSSVIKLPAGVTAPKSTHLRMIVPQSDIEGTKF
jgi:hypothetical protein